MYQSHSNVSIDERMVRSNSFKQYMKDNRQNGVWSGGYQRILVMVISKFGLGYEWN